MSQSGNRTQHKNLLKTTVAKSTPPTPFMGSTAYEDFVLMFATTAEPKPDPSHAFAIKGPPNKLLFGDALIANPRNHQKN